MTILRRNKKHGVNQAPSQAVSVAPLTVDDLKNHPTIKELLSRMPDKVVMLTRISRKELEALAIEATKGLSEMMVFCEHLVALAESNKLEEPLWSFNKKVTELATEWLGVNSFLLYNLLYGNDGPGSH